MSEIYEVNVCNGCPIANTGECFLHFHGGRPPCGMVAEENFHSLQQLKDGIAALIEWYDIPKELAIEQRTVNRAQLLEKLRQLSTV